MIFAAVLSFFYNLFPTALSPSLKSTSTSYAESGGQIILNEHVIVV